jgi:hypothetical protein
LDSNALLGFLKHVINIIMWIMYKGCYNDYHKQAVLI